mgnify:CR=1 FL=1
MGRVPGGVWFVLGRWPLLLLRIRAQQHVARRGQDVFGNGIALGGTCQRHGAHQHGQLSQRQLAALGRVGVLDQHCPHRGASLFFGRNEEGGVRCVYHGWKFGVDGECLDMPTEASDSPMRCKGRARAYPARIAGGVLWVYMGEPDKMPPLPDFEWLGLPSSHVYVSRWEQDCNYAQAMEGELDSAHVGFLHSLVDKTHDDDRALTRPRLTATSCA